MRTSFMVSIFVLLIAAGCFAQDPVSVIDFSWQRDHQAAKKQELDTHGPVRMVTDDNKNFQRKAREQLTVVAIDPNEATVDGRSIALEKANAEARAAKLEDVNGYSFRTNVKNNSDKTLKIIFWEYRFAELVNPQNVVRRQFICSVNIKPNDKKELSTFSVLGPSDVISAENLARSGEKLFDEKVVINRFEFSDGTLRQRSNWKYDDFQKSIEHATSTPWGKEVCRAF